MNFVDIFQSLAFPVAVCVVLFVAFGYFAKKIMANMEKREEQGIKLRDQFIASLQQSNATLTEAVTKNAAAFDRLTDVLEKIERKIKKEVSNE